MAESRDPARIGAMFSRIAAGYDRMNRLMSLGQDRAWRSEAVRIAGPLGDEWALDLGCGTGDLILAIAPHCRGVVGLDFNQDMLHIAQAKARRHGINARLVQADALRMPFAGNTFGCIVTGFALRNVLNIDQALREMLRVTQPGGRMACLELTLPEPGMMSRAALFYSQEVVPMMGRLVTGEAEAYRYLPNSVASFPSASKLKAMMCGAGWQNTGYRRLSCGTVAIHFGEKGK